MKRWIPWAVALLAVLVLALAIGRLVSERRATQAAAAAPKAAPVLDLPPGDIVKAAMVDLERTLEISGTVRAASSAFVKARVAAEVRRVNVREGDAVKQGQVLVQQDTTEFDLRVRQAEEQARSARAQLDIAERALANNKALVTQGFISATALETSTSNQAAAQANLAAAETAVQLARKARADTTLTAPLSGLVSQRLAQPGERAGVDARLLEIVDLSKLELEAALAPEDVATLRVGSTAALRVDGIGTPIGARVVRINPSAQAGSRTVQVYLSVDPHPALRHGLFARGSVALERRRALAVPATSVRLDGAQPYVMALDGGKVALRKVRTGASGQAGGVDMIEVTQGLADGAALLAGSAGLVADGTAWRPAAAAMPASARTGSPASPMPASGPQSTQTR
jgi:RND family efflux transporter MFP subunit